MNCKKVAYSVNIFLFLFFALINVSKAAHISVVNFEPNPGLQDGWYKFDLVVDSLDLTSNIPTPECINGCSIGILFKNAFGSNLVTMGIHLPSAQVHGSTLGELESEFVKNAYVGSRSDSPDGIGALPATLSGYGLQYKSASKLGYDRGACFFLGYAPGYTHQSWHTEIPDAKPAEGSYCTPLPIATISCNVDSPSIEIDHGTLLDSEIEGNKKSKSINITCDGDTTINFSLGNSETDLNSGVSSHLELSSSQLSSDNGTETITSTLHKNGKVTPGLHKSAGVILYMDWS